MKQQDLSLADDLTSELVVPPADANDVCPLCRSWLDGAGRYCEGCTVVLKQVTEPCRHVIPISLYCKPSPMRDWLKFYKPHEEDYHPEFRPNIACILGAFLYYRGQSLFDSFGGIDSVCVVPSSSREGQHPLAELYESLDLSPKAPLLEALRRGTGKVGHRKASDSAFVLRADVKQRRILLLDDVYTTGGTAQSAASALQLGEAIVPAILVVGRRLNPDYHASVKAIWDRQKLLPYRFHHPPF